MGHETFLDFIFVISRCFIARATNHIGWLFE